MILFLLGLSAGIIIGSALIAITLLKGDIAFERILKEDKEKHADFINFVP